MAEVRKYAREVQTVQRQLEEANQLIAHVNNEERLFEWEPTEYPRVAEITALIEPYTRLYLHALKWEKSLRRWMDSSLGEFPSETIETETDEMHRDCFKFAKIFDKQFAPRQLALDVRAAISNFKKNSPMIQVKRQKKKNKERETTNSQRAFARVVFI